MLHNMDACQIAQTGRGYLQVGNNEVYDLFQAGWSGAPYSEECRKAVAQMINLDGTPCSVKNTFVKETFENEKEITQLQAITKYIAYFAKEHNYRAGKRLWMNPLPKYLYLEDIIEENKEKKDVYKRQLQLFQAKVPYCSCLYSPRQEVLLLQKQYCIQYIRKSNQIKSHCLYLSIFPSSCV